MTPPAPASAHPQYPYLIVLDWPHALRVLEARHRRKGRQITPALLRSFADAIRRNPDLPAYRHAWATTLEARASVLDVIEQETPR